MNKKLLIFFLLRVILENKIEIKEFGKIFNVFSEKFFGMFGEIKRGFYQEK
jgi:hypothetical protein